MRAAQAQAFQDLVNREFSAASLGALFPEIYGFENIILPWIRIVTLMSHETAHGLATASARCPKHHGFEVCDSNP